MIPKKIHYIWLGEAEKPALVGRCIASWRRVLPDYEVVLWNDSNITCAHPVYARARRENRHAFASDVARLEILKAHGGIYMDADVEVRKSLDEFLAHRAFLGMENGWLAGTALFGAEAGHPILDGLLACHDAQDGDFVVNNVVWTRFFEKASGAPLTNCERDFPDGVRIYPKEYFVMPPLFCRGGYARHHAMNTWRAPPARPLWKRAANALIGDTLYLHLAHAKAAHAHQQEMK
ncbi:MAG: hypothetical protein LBM04_00135 [Opitutaceae bacterium]|jgi:hypothetical protein|nr:hypothetical protein [Opitutaceae bacterium]